MQVPLIDPPWFGSCTVVWVRSFRLGSYFGRASRGHPPPSGPTEPGVEKEVALTLVEALALGVVQGVTEFLPISSDGHLALAHLLVGAGENDLVFDVVAHLGTMLAILILLRKRIGDLVRAGLALLGRSDSDPELPVHQRWMWLVIVASVPTAVVGLLLEATTESMRLQPLWLGMWFLATAALIFAAERLGARTRDARSLGVVDALLIGFAQGLAVLPGLSRSGTTVATGLWRNLNPAVAVDFSLLISVPAVLGANLLKLPEIESQPIGPLLAGFAAALVTGIGAVKLLQWIVVTRKLLPFSIYCAVLGVTTIAIGFFRG
jgi:undecaprenyl-diphosphatase